jgi:hypothetical protein
MRRNSIAGSKNHGECNKRHLMRYPGHLVWRGLVIDGGQKGRREFTRSSKKNHTLRQRQRREALLRARGVE